MHVVGCLLSDTQRNYLLMLPLTYEGLAVMKGLISIHYIRLDMYASTVKPLKCDLQSSTAISNQSPCKSICTHIITQYDCIATTKSQDLGKSLPI